MSAFAAEPTNPNFSSFTQPPLICDVAHDSVALLGHCSHPITGQWTGSVGSLPLPWAQGKGGHIWFSVAVRKPRASAPLSSALALTATLLPVAGLRLNFTASWGDLHYLGLTGLEVVGRDGQALPVLPHQLSACPRDLNDLPEYAEDPRTLDK